MGPKPAWSNEPGFYPAAGNLPRGESKLNPPFSSPGALNQPSAVVSSRPKIPADPVPGASTGTLNVPDPDPQGALILPEHNFDFPKMSLNFAMFLPQMLDELWTDFTAWKEELVTDSSDSELEDEDESDAEIWDGHDGGRRDRQEQGCRENDSSPTQSSGALESGASISPQKRLKDDKKDKRRADNRTKRKRKNKPEFRRSGLACPFWKKDPSRYEHCGTRYFTGTNRVKAHLRKDHIWCCTHCGTKFMDCEDLEKHSDPFTCDERVVDWDDSWLNYDQAWRLRRPVRWRVREPPITIENQWYEIWMIVFPTTQPPPNPYNDHHTTETLLFDMWIQGPGVQRPAEVEQSFGVPSRDPAQAEADLHGLRLAGYQRTYRDVSNLSDVTPLGLPVPGQDIIIIGNSGSGIGQPLPQTGADLSDPPQDDIGQGDSVDLTESESTGWSSRDTERPNPVNTAVAQNRVGGFEVEAAGLQDLHTSQPELQYPDRGQADAFIEDQFWYLPTLEDAQDNEELR